MKNHNIFTFAKGFFLLIFFCLIFISCKKKSDISNQKEIVHFSFYSADLTEEMDFEDDIAKEITNRTGVILDLIPRSAAMSDAITLMIANDNLSDYIYAKGDMSKLIEAGAVLPLDDFIEKYGENIKKLYGDQLVRLRYSLSDPSIYTVGTYEIKSKKLEVSGNMQLQHSVLKEFGYPKIQTLDDYENILKAYIAKYPKINNHKTIGMSLLTDSWFWYLTLSNPGGFVLGYPDDGQWIVDQDTMIATYKFLHPQMQVYYKWLNKIYNEGLLDPESFTQTEEDWRRKLKEGFVLGTTYPNWGFPEIKTELIKNDMQERMMAYLPVTVSEEIKDPSLKDYGFSGGWGIAISKNCKDPEKAFKFLDWFCSEEAQILVNWGIEDQHYYYDNNGERKSFPYLDEQTIGIGRWVYPFPQGGSGYTDSTGNPLAKISIENIKQNYSSSEQETLQAYGVDLWTDLFPSPQELKVSKHGQVWQYALNGKMTDKVNEVDNYVKEALINMIIGSTDKFDESWNQMQKTIIDLGIKEIETEITRLIDEKMQLWY
ncbi:MAG: extracellular solute-binding protein [Treponema sp.]|nr:extracellular solute-binding protein [Treponema sp.]